jgi:MFS family permease
MARRRWALSPGGWWRKPWLTASWPRHPNEEQLLTSAAGRAAAIIFTASGILTGTLASRWPWLAARLHLSSGVIGVLGLVSSVGALVAMPFAARFVHRYGARAATCVLTVAMGITLVLPPFAPGVVVLAVIFVVMGAAIGTQDNAMNTSAVEAEKEAGKTIMSGLHGMWSIGVLAGALAGSLAARLNVDPRIQFTAMGVLIAAAGLASAPWLAGGPATGPVAENEVPRFVWPRGLILLIGLVGFAAVFVEFAASSWAALFMHWTLHTSQATAALAAALFALAMAAGRLAGNIIVGAVGPTWSVRGCGILATVGCLVVAVAPGTWIAVLGFVLIGLGVSVVVPLAFAAAGHSGSSPAMGVAGVATISYGAGLAAPSLMGGVAEVASLRVAFGIAAAIAIMIAAGAGLLGRTAAEMPVLASAEATTAES